MMSLLKVIGSITVRWSAYNFLFAFYRNYSFKLCRFRHTCIATYFSKDAFSTLRVFCVPLEWLYWNFTVILGCRKLESCDYRVALFACPAFSRVDRTLACNERTEGQTNGQTDTAPSCSIIPR